MGSVDRPQAESPEGAETLIRRVKRAKESTKREPSGGGASEAQKQRRTDDDKVDGIEIPLPMALGMFAGMILSLGSLEEERKKLFPDGLDDLDKRERNLGLSFNTAISFIEMYSELLADLILHADENDAIIIPRPLARKMNIEDDY